MGDLDPPSNAWFPGPTRVLNPNGISIGSAVFAGLISVTDRQTDRQMHATRSVTIGGICVRTAIRPNKYLYYVSVSVIMTMWSGVGGRPY